MKTTLCDHGVSRPREATEVSIAALMLQSLPHPTAGTPRTAAHRAPLSMGFPGKDTGCRLHSGGLPGPGVEPQNRLHFRQILY